MLISLTSPTRSSSRKGFTLIELLISIAIIGVISSIVLVKYSTFDSTTLLKGLAYEIALSLREAQVRSVSVARGETSFDYPFGVTFAPGKEYIAFQYGSSTDSWPWYDVDETPPTYASDIQTFSIGRTMEITDVCVTVGVTETCGLSRLDVSFKRPKFRGLFNAHDSTILPEDIDSATIKVGAQGTNTFLIRVTNLGQITVEKE